ncbi:hypothetical protein GCM10023221_20500 [Luteimicrobium xylanilyticum]|uniref:Secreted protein n=1 Tax=Luteimicrobium xylanilyticum TaxID=1133546 RepID=A0A5P9Q6X0_9MICO|nr:hypothetical protein [Luteimicrobium xylanilyticum]QFU97016.1 hypothetical protein KDY119_00509 [Luteimicrobium xylanilyticum]
MTIPGARRRLSRGLVAVLVTALAALVALTGAAFQLSRSYADDAPHVSVLATSTLRAERAYLVDCSHQPVFRPTSFTVTCGDANAAIESVDWSRWTTAEAEGTATYVENDCDPYCAAGHLREYPVEVRADRVSRDGSAHVFRRLVLTFPDRHPGWVTGGRTTFDVDFRESGA